MRDRRLALAALDPIGAIDAPEDSGGDVFEGEVVEDLKPGPHALTMVVEVEKPARHSRWRFWLFYVLVKLVARIYPFNFEIYRTPK